ncbi:MAG TPA: hypothetical protein V6C90_11890 [Coleofasciculaceae cyanobacterium]
MAVETAATQDFTCPEQVPKTLIFRQWAQADLVGLAATSSRHGLSGHQCKRSRPFNFGCSDHQISPWHN